MEDSNISGTEVQDSEKERNIESSRNSKFLGTENPNFSGTKTQDPEKEKIVERSRNSKFSGTKLKVSGTQSPKVNFFSKTSKANSKGGKCWELNQSSSHKEVIDGNQKFKLKILFL